MSAIIWQDEESDNLKMLAYQMVRSMKFLQEKRSFEQIAKEAIKEKYTNNKNYQLALSKCEKDALIARLTYFLYRAAEDDLSL